MARFDVYPHRGSRGYLLDCQTDYLSALDTRLTVPLLLRDDFLRPAERLNPVFEIEGKPVVMMTQYAAAIEKRLLGERVASLAGEQDVIMNAIDMLLTGF